MKLQHLLGKAEHVMGIPIHVKADADAVELIIFHFDHFVSVDVQQILQVTR